jgi:hypothetical protein
MAVSFSFSVFFKVPADDLLRGKICPTTLSKINREVKKITTCRQQNSALAVVRTGFWATCGV